MPFTHQSGHYLTQGSARIYYELAGDPAAPQTLLLLHGGYGHIADFNPLLAQVKGRYRLLGIDSRGQGRSTLGEQPLSYPLLEQDVEAVLNHLAITTVSIIGLSDGGIIAYRLAAGGRVDVRHLVTLSARWHPRDVEQTRDQISSADLAAYRAQYPHALADYERLNPDPNPQRLLDALVQMWLDAPAYPAETLARITAPTLVVRGDDDTLISLSTAAQAARLISGAHLANLPFAAHPVQHDQPAALALHIERLLTFTNA